MRWLLPLVAVTVFASPTLAKKKPGVIELHWGFGTPTAFSISGRVLKDKGIRAPAVHRSYSDNLIDTIKTFETDEVEGAVVEISFDGRKLRGETDDDGNFLIEANNIHPPLTVGDLPVKARAVVDKGYRVKPASSFLRIFPDEPILVVISDFDDTTVETAAKSKFKLVRNAILRNASQIKPVAGAPIAYRRALKAGAAGFIYLSGSPINFHTRIQDFLRKNELPSGPVLLKNFGSEALFEQSEYKTWRLERIRKALPKARFVMLGDSGEQDTEIYDAFVKRHPGVVHGVIIRRVRGDESPPGRFRRCFVVDDWEQDPDLIAAMVQEAMNGFRPPAPEAERAKQPAPEGRPSDLPR
jgi:phosphatidate phosphatase APP1